jgi:hypothetical protein
MVVKTMVINYHVLRTPKVPSRSVKRIVSLLQELSEYLGFALTYHSAKNLFEQKLRDRVPWS